MIDTDGVTAHIEGRQIMNRRVVSDSDTCPEENKTAMGWGWGDLERVDREVFSQEVMFALISE